LELLFVPQWRVSPSIASFLGEIRRNRADHGICGFAKKLTFAICRMPVLGSVEMSNERVSLKTLNASGALLTESSIGTQIKASIAVRK